MTQITTRKTNMKQEKTRLKQDWNKKKQGYNKKKQDTTRILTKVNVYYFKHYSLGLENYN